MKTKRFSWPLAVALVAIAAQSLFGARPASAKDAPLFMTETFIRCDGSVEQSEDYYWFYPEGEGNFSAVTSGTDDQGHAIIVTPGYQKASAISYEQQYSADNGNTYFWKTFVHDPERVPNLEVKTSVSFQGDLAAGSSRAGYEETLGLAVISTGGPGSVSGGTTLLSLCPWASASRTESGAVLPATSLSISAGSSFVVSDIQGFFSEGTMIHTDAPYLGYSVETLPGRGSIGAWFTADFSAATGPWGTHDIGICSCGPYPTGILAIDDPPPQAGRMSYSSEATAEGVWTFTKNTSYQGSGMKPIPIFQVP
jgi:hypothetical protein